MVLGSGPSVNLLTVATYERLRQHVDVWSINTAWVNRVVQPDFWHMEFHTMNVDVVEAPGGMLDFQKRFLHVESWGNVLISMEKLRVGSHAVVVQDANGAFWVQRAGRSQRAALEEPIAMATTWVRRHCPSISVGTAHNR